MINQVHTQASSKHPRPGADARAHPRRAAFSNAKAARPADMPSLPTRDRTAETRENASFFLSYLVLHAVN